MDIFQDLVMINQDLFRITQSLLSCIYDFSQANNMYLGYFETCVDYLRLQTRYF